ncbi:MAG: thioredoxin [Chitinophagaceae bacterium]
MENAFTELIGSSTPTLVDFYATWCGPCKMMPPILKELKKKIGDQAKIIQVDVDKSPEVARQYQIQGVPTLALFRDGQIIWRQSGVVQAEFLRQVITRHLPKSEQP